MRIATLYGPLMLNNDHRRLVTASWEDRFNSQFISSAANIGDWFVTKVTRDHLRCDSYYMIYPDAPDSDWQILNEECDVLVLKGGNFIFSGWIEKYLPLRVLKKVKIPIVYIGAGLQAPRGVTALDLTDGDVASLKFIHDSCRSCMVRGDSTAEALKTLGINNVRVIGCPTLFWSRKPEIRVKVPNLERVGWTMRNTLYTNNPEISAAQFSAISRLRDRARILTVMLQGEEISLERFFMADRYQAYTVFKDEPSASRRLIRSETSETNLPQLREAVIKQYREVASVEVLDWIMRHSFYSLDVGDYIRLAKDLDFVAGCRLHGNIVALSHGTPAYFFLYDERTREIVDLFNIPSRVLDPANLDIDLGILDYRPFERRYRELFSEYKAFLEENGIAHRLD